MKRKVVLRLLSLVMVASMTGTMLPSNIQTASAEEVDVTEKTAALEDGINDAWTQDNKADGDTVTVENGWLHIKSAAGNRNNPGTRPQMVVNPNTFDFNKPGYFSFTLKSNNANTGISDSDRVGVYLDMTMAAGSGRNTKAATETIISRRENLRRRKIRK